MYDVFDPCGPYILKHTISPGIFSHIIHPRHCTMVPYHKRTIPYTWYCVFPVPYRQRIPYHIRWFSHTPIYHTTNISHIPYSYRVRQSELGRRLYTRPGACYYCCSAVLLCKRGDEPRVLGNKRPSRPHGACKIPVDDIGAMIGEPIRTQVGH